jgi:hypothetical protein
MIETPYIDEVSAERAQEWERRFQQLPPDAGVIFISITAVPELGGDCHAYEVRLGINREFKGTANGILIVQHVLAEEIASGRYRIHATAHRGVSGSARFKSGQR